MEDQDTLELDRGQVEAALESASPGQESIGGGSAAAEATGSRKNTGRTFLTIILAITLCLVLGAIFAIAIVAGSAPELGAPQTDANLTGRVWQWYYFSDPSAGAGPIANSGHYTVLFGSNGTVSVVADCNSGGGEYSAAGGKIDIRITALTAAECAPDSLGAQFARLLNEVVAYSFVGSTLLLELPADSGVMQLSETPPVTTQLPGCRFEFPEVGPAFANVAANRSTASTILAGS